MAAGPFRVEFNRSPALRGRAISIHVRPDGADLADRGVQPLSSQAEARLARWLLMTRDRVLSDDFPHHARVSGAHAGDEA